MFGNFSSFKTPSPGPVSLPSSFVSPFIFYILSYLLLKTMGYLSGCLVQEEKGMTEDEIAMDGLPFPSPGGSS